MPISRTLHVVCCAVKLMWNFVTFVALLAAVGVAASSVVEDVPSSLAHDVVHAKWSAYKAKYGKQYGPRADNAKMAVFLENARIIELHNERYYEGLESFEMGYNELVDLDLDEIQSTHMGLLMTADDIELRTNASEHIPLTGIAYPDSVDWRSRGAVTSVKNQLGCASCYAFAATGALETAHWRKYGNLVDISEQHFIDCTRSYGNRGCGGGTMHSIFRWLKDHDGYVAQNEYKYWAGVGICQDSKKTKIGNIDKYVTIRSGDEDALLDAVATTGVVAVAIWNRIPAYVFYRQGILDVPTCVKERATHAVVIVGYGSENGKDYWILKNSYGPNWGEKGYFRMRRGVNMCGVANWAVYPVIA